MIEIREYEKSRKSDSSKGSHATFSIDEDDRRLPIDATDAGALSDRDPSVAIVAPGSTPRVLDEPIVAPLMLVFI